MKTTLQENKINGSGGGSLFRSHRFKKRTLGLLAMLFMLVSLPNVANGAFILYRGTPGNWTQIASYTTLYGALSAISSSYNTYRVLVTSDGYLGRPTSSNDDVGYATVIPSNKTVYLESEGNNTYKIIRSAYYESICIAGTLNVNKVSFDGNNIQTIYPMISCGYKSTYYTYTNGKLTITGPCEIKNCKKINRGNTNIILLTLGVKMVEPYLFMVAAVYSLAPM